MADVVDFVFSEHNSDSSMTIMNDGRRIIVDMSAQDFDDSPPLKEKYLHFLHVAESFELNGLTVEDFYDWVLEILAPILAGARLQDSQKRPTLRDFLYPETLHYKLYVVGESIVPSSTSGNGAQPFLGTRFPRPPNLLALKPQQVEIVAESSSDALVRTPRRVSVDDLGICFFKPLRVADAQSAQREIATYEKISRTITDEHLRIPQLLALVCDESSDMIFGLLISYVDCGSVTLACALGPDTSADRRRRWAEQIRYTLASLHEIDVIWGDAKPDNILIDVEDNAWMIDFGGGRTEGWVDEEVADTIEGDLQGLGRILELLDIHDQS